MNIIGSWIAQFILLTGHQAQAFWNNLVLLNFSYQQIIIDILLVAVFFYFIFSLLKGSRAVHILIGLVIIAIIFFLSKTLQLVTLSWLLDRFFTVALVAIPVIFQQELRMGLERLGHTKFFLNQQARSIDRMIANIVDACAILAQTNQGALIVIRHTVPLKEYADTGIPLNAKVSKELLLSIFNPRSPLHDGAVIIENEAIQAASCLLPHSFKSNAAMMGTRHKAALGLAESTDAGIIVVSEEQGAISFAHRGSLEKSISVGRLQTVLREMLKPAKRKIMLRTQRRS